jgi:hypothetical protein
MERPRAVSTSRNTGSASDSEKLTARRQTTSSIKINQAPRVTRNRASAGFEPSRSSLRNAPAPARSMNVGAQKWVIQRVKKRNAVVLSKFSG